MLPFVMQTSGWQWWADLTEGCCYCSRGDGDGVDTDADADEQQAVFEREMPLPLRVIKATFDVLLSHSELLCYFAMVLNAMVTGSLLSIVYPVLAFLWAMLSSPRPSKSFWVFAITYTEVRVFQFTCTLRYFLKPLYVCCDVSVEVVLHKRW